MKVRISLQTADYEEQPRGKADAEQAKAIFAETDWDTLRADARALKRDKADFCPPGVYIEFKNNDGYRLVLHFYCQDMDRDVFAMTEMEKMEPGLARRAPRPAAQDRHAENLSRDDVNREIDRFFNDLPDKALRIHRHRMVSRVITYRDFRGGMKMIAFIVTACFLACAAILLHIAMTIPELRPAWFDGVLQALPWLEELYR